MSEENAAAVNASSCASCGIAEVDDVKLTDCANCTQSRTVLLCSRQAL